MSTYPNNLYVVWCEWDIGQEYLVFLTEDLALEWAAAAYYLQQGENEEEETFEELLAEGLIDVSTVSFISSNEPG